MDLTDEQWNMVETILPEDPVRDDGRGRPWSDRRKVLSGVLWILRTGAPWPDLPPRHGPYQTGRFISSAIDAFEVSQNEFGQMATVTPFKQTEHWCTYPAQ